MTKPNARAASGTRRPLPGFGVKGRLGTRGHGMVRGVVERGLARILWTERGKRRTESWPDTPDGRKQAAAYGQGVYDRLKQIAAGVPVGPTFTARTVRELWDAYRLAQFDHMRVRTRENYSYHWRQFEAFIGPQRIAAEVTPEHLDAFRKELRKSDVYVNQIAHTIAMVKRVWSFAIYRDLIPPSKVATYSFQRGKDEKRHEVAEYSREEAAKILGQFDPRDPKDWRCYVAIMLFAFAGPRSRAALHLEWRDVDLVAGTIRWRPELAKTGEEHVQPVPPEAVAALWVAYGWRCTLGYPGPFLFFRPAKALMERDRRTGRYYPSVRRQRSATGAAEQPWTYSSFHGRLQEAEEAAGVPHLDYRAAHGFRRLVVGDVLAKTGNLVLAGQYIGDRDLRTLRRSYVRTRPEELRAAADVLTTPPARATSTAPATPETAPETQSAPRADGEPKEKP